MNPVKVGIFTIYFRGIRILDAVTDALLTAGVNAANHVILTGCSGELQNNMLLILNVSVMYSWRV